MCDCGLILSLACPANKLSTNGDVSRCFRGIKSVGFFLSRTISSCDHGDKIMYVTPNGDVFYKP